MTELVEWFKALADPLRLRIVTLILAAEELCVCDIHEILGMSQPKTSRHLAYLKRCGMLVDRRVGLWIMYSLNGELPPILRDLLKRLLLENDQLASDVKKLKKNVAQECCTTFTVIPGIKVPNSLRKI